ERDAELVFMAVPAAVDAVMQKRANRVVASSGTENRHSGVVALDGTGFERASGPGIRPQKRRKLLGVAPSCGLGKHRIVIHVPGPLELVAEQVDAPRIAVVDAGKLAVRIGDFER